MESNSILFDSEYPDIGSVRALVQNALELHRLLGIYQVDDILAEVCHQRQQQITLGSIVEIHQAWLKTACLEVVERFSKQHESRRRFDMAVQALFDPNNPDAHPFCAAIARRLKQFRLLGAYEAREIIVEAYTRGVNRIESGQPIPIPLGWLRLTCFNVIQELRRKQNKAENPKVDGDVFNPGDQVFARLVFAEDIKAMRSALQALSAEDQQLLCSRVLKKLLWQEIGESLSQAEATPINANTARQRGFRALQKLRQHYDEIRQIVKLTDDEFGASSDFEEGQSL